MRTKLRQFVHNALIPLAIPRLLLLAVTSALLQGCAWNSSTAWRAALAGGGAAAGYYLADQSGAGAAAGAVGAVVLGEAALTAVAKGKEREFLLGYELGMNDAVKRQYWIIQAQQRQKPAAAAAAAAKAQTVYYNFPGPEEFQGVRYVPHSVQMEVQQ